MVADASDVVGAIRGSAAVKLIQADVKLVAF
jgi:hypothetical protein